MIHHSVSRYYLLNTTHTFVRSICNPNPWCNHFTNCNSSSCPLSFILVIYHHVRLHLFTTPIYYTNDVPHVGHAYSSIIADVMSRSYRMLGREVKFCTWVDENSQKLSWKHRNSICLSHNILISWQANIKIYEMVWLSLTQTSSELRKPDTMTMCRKSWIKHTKQEIYTSECMKDCIV